MAEEVARTAVDNLTRTQRSYCMSRIRRQDTQPEMRVRKIARLLRYRFVIGVNSLPGKPDLAFPRRKKIIFVNGCFWHCHACRNGRATPQTNAHYWREKRELTVKRDRSHRRELRKLGWSVLTLWECQIANEDRTRERIAAFLRKTKRVAATQ
jgi:DNA mismatch endonuclease (patch repair protein)